jgi:ABC-type nitrate/sulfonate/bicarbonate transport system substrate-binding protein
MKNYRVVVEEVYRGWEWVEANSVEEAEQIVRDMTRRGELEPTLSYDAETFIDVVDEEDSNA